ncbi:hypothetical protein ScPMuIL_011293 [Solemya velum]
MDSTTVTAARIYKGQLNGNTGEENFLNFEKFPSVALSKTYNTDQQTPDSAGTATAIMSGIKTKIGIIGLHAGAKHRDCNSSKGTELNTILDWSHEKGKSTGLVTTSRITHATPAAAYAHAASRNWESDRDLPNYVIPGSCKDIAYQLVHDNSFINVILGGGRNAFQKAGQIDPETLAANRIGRLDTDLIEDWVSDKLKRGEEHSYVWNKKQFEDIDATAKDFVLGLFEPSHMQYEQDRNTGPDGEPSLAEMTRKAIEILQKNEEGFFLMVEGARIDHGHHRNIAKIALQETLAFEKAVGEAMMLTNEEDTLIIVTADHGHVFNMAGYPERGNDILGVTDPNDSLPYTTLLYGNGPGYDHGTREHLTNNKTARDEFVQASAVPLASETHGGQDVVIYARGPMSHLFHGVHEQNYIAHVMAFASCVGDNKDHCEHINEKSGSERTAIVSSAQSEFDWANAVPLQSETHGGHGMVFYACGPMPYIFIGVHKHNCTAHVMTFASCVGENKEHYKRYLC